MRGDILCPLQKFQIRFEKGRCFITHAQTSPFDLLGFIVAQQKKCGNTIVTLFAIVFENIHFRYASSYKGLGLFLTVLVFFVAGLGDFAGAAFAFDNAAFLAAGFALLAGFAAGFSFAVADFAGTAFRRFVFGTAPLSAG